MTRVLRIVETRLTVALLCVATVQMAADGAENVAGNAAPPSTVKVDFRYAYFPSYNLIRACVPAPPTDAKQWHLAVRPADGDKILAERAGGLPMSGAGENLKLPDLAAGDYRLTLTLTGGAEPVIEERSFQRNHDEWENQKLGLEEVVIPPFEPLTANAQKQTVTCVLREHTHGTAGLWRQVTSQGRELLAGPVRLEATSGGKTVVANGDPITFRTIKPTRVTGKASWQAGPLAGKIAVKYDYDGLMELTLGLAPTETDIDRLQLVIPLKASEAWLMHPVTGMLRHHYAGRIPAGSGKVWDSSSVPHRIGGAFVPYLFVGGPERGICFAADNDRDWIRGDQTPMLEIDRQGDTVHLRLNLIGKHAQLTRERTIAFALQATPAKPMPEEPYNWRRWWATGTARDGEDVQIRFWGANMYWGGRHFATSVFPDSKDFTFWQQLAESRRTGKPNPEYEKEWLARFEKLPPDKYNSLRAHFRAGLSWAPGITPETKNFNYVIPYTNPRGCSLEDRDFATSFIDEWQTIDIVDPAWPRASDFERVKRNTKGFATWYHIEPVPTRVDMLLHYHKNMLETFADGIYWDNFFLRPCYIPAEAGGPGYVDDDGKLRPGVNLMAFRDLTKRTAVMMHQMGKRPLIYIHMTNTNIVPMLSFGTLNLDWEWRDLGDWAKKDLQDRLGADEDTALILAQSLGLQAGNISVAIDRFRPPADSGVTREWLFRTVMAVCLPHEIKVYQGTREVSQVQNQLAEFGYGQADCRVYRYWEEGYPLAADGAKVRALVLARGGKAMLAVGSYGDGGEAMLKLDLESLGLDKTARAFDAEQLARNQEAVASGKAPPEDSPARRRAELKRTGPGEFVLPIRKHDFALILVE